jgi:hypothetical protein
MSTSSFDVMQKKPDDATVTWREYEALRDHLQGVIQRSTDSIYTDVQAVEMKVDATDATINFCKRKLMISRSAYNN